MNIYLPSNVNKLTINSYFCPLNKLKMYKCIAEKAQKQ